LPDSENLYSLNSVGANNNQIPKVKAPNLSQLIPNTYTTVRARVTDLAGNQALRRALDHVCKVPFASPSSRVLLPKTLPGSKEILPIASEHHRALIEAIERREGARAESLGREHARLTRRNLEEALADQTFLETIPGARLIKLRSVN
jgi:GntR family transcriptional regulator of vanillate catabolism